MDTLAFIPTFLKSQLLTRIPYPTSSFSGQTVIVTGSNTGLGLEAARHLVRLGAAKVILGVRSLAKGTIAAEDITTSCNVPPSIVEVWELDMGSISSVKAFAKRAEGLERLDAAILNAGMLTYQFRAQAGTGVEETLAVNVLGTMLLTCLLLPTMRDSAKRGGTGMRGRLTIVGSDLMFVADTSELERVAVGSSFIDELSDPEVARMPNRYALTKLLTFYNLQHLASFHPPSTTDVVLTVLTPGACKSSIFRDESSYVMKFVMGAANAVVARTTEVGSRTLVHAVSREEDGGVGVEGHGRFLMDERVVGNGSNVDSAKGKKLAGRWNEELFAWLEMTVPGCTKVRELLSVGDLGV